MEKLKPRDIIGNTVTLAHESNSPIVTILAASPERIAYEMNGEILHTAFSQVLGIPLTPEILTENLEFVSDNLLDEDRTPILYNGVMYFDLSMNCFINDEPIHCDFVHTVQDLMFLHTREELEFKTTEG